MASVGHLLKKCQTYLQRGIICKQGATLCKAMQNKAVSIWAFANSFLPEKNSLSPKKSSLMQRKSSLVKRFVSPI